MQRLDAAVGAICIAESKAELVSAISAAIAPFGLQTFNFSINKQHQREFMRAPTLTTWSDADLNVYARGTWSDRDPLLDRAAQMGIREVWAPRDWAHERETHDYYEFIKSAGVLGGATASISSRPGTLGALTALSVLPGRIDPDAPFALSVLGQCALIRASVLGFEGLDLPAASARLSALSGQQMEILKWASRGKSNADIAAIMDLTPRNVHYHMSEILRKVGVRSRVQAAALFSGG